MKNLKKSFLSAVAVLMAFTLCLFAACDKKDHDPNGGGSTVEKPNGLDNSKAEDSIENAGKVDVDDVKSDVNVPVGAVTLSDDEIVISKNGDYYVTGSHKSVTIDKKITAHLYFDNATLNNIDGKAFSSKKSEITLTLIGENAINSGSDNAVHIKGDLTVNGSGKLTVGSQGKNGIKVSKKLTVVDATLNVCAANHAITAETIVANGCKINVTSAGKDGLHAECDYDYDEDDGIDLTKCVYSSEIGFVSLIDVEYSCDIKGDGIQADTFVYVDGGSYNIKTTGEFVQDTTENRSAYGLTSDDFRYKYSRGVYQKVASDEARGTLYALAQGCKGIKVGEIEFDSDGDGEDDKVVTDNADYSIMIKGGEFVIDSTDDALHTNSGDLIVNGGKFVINTTDDGMHADNLLKINDGEIDVQTSYEGLEGGYVEINGGTIKVVSTDDGVNAASDDRNIKEHIIITAGTVTVDAEGDGIDSNGTVLISGGVVTVFGPSSGMNGGLDADNGILVDGGTLFVTSVLGMVETPGSNSKQYVVSYGTKTSLSKGDVISVKDSGGNELISVTLIKSCQSVIVSVADFKKGKTYSIYNGDDLIETFTISQVLTQIGTSQGNFGPGGGGRPGSSGRRW